MIWNYKISQDREFPIWMYLIDYVHSQINLFTKIILLTWSQWRRDYGLLEPPGVGARSACPLMRTHATDWPPATISTTLEVLAGKKKETEM